MRYLFKIFVLSTLIVFAFSCSKDDETPEPAAIVTPTPTPPVVTEDPNTNPALLMTLPGQNLTFSVGSYVKIEGIATDAEGLKGIVCVGTANDYYNYTFTDTFYISGTNTAFADSIFIPDNICPGNLNLQFFAIDLMDSISNIITRNETTQDNINPTMYYNTNSVHEFDSIIVTVYRNSFNIVDSLDILNQTTGQVIGSIKDNIGFKYIKIKAREDEQADYYKLFLQKDLITDNSVSYHVKLPANYPGPSGWYSYIYFAIGLDELDDITSISSIYNYNGHNMVFDF